MDDKIIHADRWASAVATFQSGDRAGALILFKTFAQEGSLFALTEIGNIYELGGGGVTQDFKQAKHWYERAIAEGNDSDAYVALARLYYLGRGVSRDSTKAYELYSAIEKELRPGVLYILGYMHEHGEGVTKDINKAIDYYSVSGKLGHALSKKDFARLKIRRGEFMTGILYWIKAIFLIIWIGTKNIDDPRLKIS
jgi:TPR repeat protein